MSEALTIHVVQTFIEIDGYPVAEEPVACQSAPQAKAKAQAARGSKLGVTAWSRTSPDPGLGDWGDPVIIARYGKIPEEFEASGAMV
ncbi:hypothetical protein [Xanthobacter autotrophicus]|uniref:hypothetical protein n=1 Tax=Xanthobacter autotrophicus TaxID=280 RepID=UPI00372C886D